MITELKKLKIQVAKDETTMQDKLIELIKRYLDEKIKRGTRKVDKKLYLGKGRGLETLSRFH